jgi:aldehyde dehydrogenase (NAD+)
MNTKISADVTEQTNPLSSNLQSLRDFFDSRATREYAFRHRQLFMLRQAVLKYEKDIADALFKDLRKSREESYFSETGLVLADISLCLKNLRQWMRPKRVPTNLVNFPSTNKIFRDPLGVVFIIAPWNYPFQLLFLPLVGAIAGGNCALLKPSELAPATELVVEKIIRELFPPHYIQIKRGDGAELVPALMNAFRFDHIFYTGSITVGRKIYQQAASALIPVTLELGGKSPAVVEGDANILVTARRLAFGKFLNAGQTCIAPDYLLVHRSVKDQLVHELRKTIADFFGTDSSQSDYYGKIINEKRFESLLSYIPQGRILAGGNYDKSRLYIAPTLMDEVGTDCPVMKEEIFGPILPIFVFDSMEEAVGLIRKNPDPLAMYIFTSNRKKEVAWIDAVPFGGGCINNTAYQYANPHLPFGGIGRSGIGAYHGKYSYYVFTHAKPVLKTPVWIDPKIRYPPFSGRLNIFKWIIR